MKLVLMLKPQSFGPHRNRAVRKMVVRLPHFLHIIVLDSIHVSVSMFELFVIFP